MDLIHKQKTFSICRVVIGDTPIQASDFKHMKNEMSWDQRVDGKIINQTKITTTVIENRFICFYFEEGGIFPRPEKVFNVDTELEEENPRQDTQIERENQNFYMIDCATQTIYISNLKKQYYMENLLKEIFPDKRIIITNIIDVGRFLETLDSVKKVYVSAVPSLLTSVGSLGEALQYDVNNYGDEVENMELIITFKDAGKLGRKQKSGVSSFVGRLMREKENHAITKLQVTGNYSENFSRVFNGEEIVDRINIRVPVEQNGLFDDKKVFSTLINKIYEQEGT